MKLNPQKWLPHWRFNSSREPYLFLSQSWNSERQMLHRQSVPPNSLSVCQPMTMGCFPKCSAIARVILSERNLYVPVEKQLFFRPPQTIRVPSVFMAIVSGYFLCSHAGITAVGVPMIALISYFCSRSRTSSSHWNSNCPSVGSRFIQENSASLTMLKPACFMSLMSVSHLCFGQCSG